MLLHVLCARLYAEYEPYKITWWGRSGVRVFGVVVLGWSTTVLFYADPLGGTISTYFGKLVPAAGLAVVQRSASIT